MSTIIIFCSIFLYVSILVLKAICKTNNPIRSYHCIKYTPSVTKATQDSLPYWHSVVQYLLHNLTACLYTSNSTFAQVTVYSLVFTVSSVFLNLAKCRPVSLAALKAATVDQHTRVSPYFSVTSIPPSKLTSKDRHSDISIITHNAVSGRNSLN